MFEIDDDIPLTSFDRDNDEGNEINNNCGIYCIENTINRKRYIGKSKNISGRFSAHKWMLRLDKYHKDCNRYLYNAVQKYGLDNFKFYILECLPINDAILMEREIYWMDFYNTCNKEYGYNLRRDTSGGMKVHEETKKLMSENFKGENNPNFGNSWSLELKQHMSKTKKEWAANRTIEEKERMGKNIGIGIKKYYEENPEARIHMSKAVKEGKTKKHSFLQISKKTGRVVKIWDSVEEIVLSNPHALVKWQNIYSVCNGYKPTYLGFIWKKVPKVPPEDHYMILTSGPIIQI